MQEGILNEPTREAAEKLMAVFGEQISLQFDHLIFVAVTEDGEFRTANISKDGGLTRDAVKLIAKHLDQWANDFEDL